MASTLMFWNKQNSNSSSNNSNGNNNGSSHNGSDAKNTKNGRNWLHAPDVLVNGHVAYLVKFLGSTPVEQAKGIEVVKEAIRRLQFTQQMKKAEGGSNVKTKKVEITVSVDGVAIQEPRTQTILHQFPLHKISYCADEKGVKKFFSFIAKTSPAGGSGGGNGSLSAASDDTHSSHSQEQDGGHQQHECFVFVSSKLASDITLTIGQAFDLAYRRYVNDSGKTVEASKLQTQNKQLENAVTVYRQRLRDLSELISKPDLDKLLLRLGLRDICEMPPALENGVGDHHNNNHNNNHNSHNNHMAAMNGNKTPDLGIDVSLPNNDDQLLIETSPKHFAPIVPPRNIQNQINSTLEAFKPSVGTKMEGLLLNSDSDSDFDPRAPDNDSPSSQMGGLGGNKISNDLFGFEPPKQSVGQQLFSSSSHSNTHTSFTNGNNGITSNGFGAPTSPPPMLAPPPQKSAPRRTTSAHQNNNNNMTNGNGYQDLFGSAPFNPQTADDTTTPFDSSFDATGLSASSFSEELKTLADNSSKLDSVLALNSSLYKTPPPAVTSSPNSHAAKTNPFAAFAGPAVAKLRSANPLASATSKLNTATYDMFQNTTTSDTDQLTGSSNSTSGVSCSGLSSFGTNSSAINSTANSTTAAAPNYHVSSHQHQLSSSTAAAAETSEAPDALFQDFALSAFNEFKRDLSNSNQRRRAGSGAAENNSKQRLSSTMMAPPSGKSVELIGATVTHHHHHHASGARLIPEKTTSKNGLFSSDDLLDTFDPLK